MSNIKKVIFVYGHGMSSPTEASDWPSHLGRELSKKGFDFIPLMMPNSMYPDIRDWLDFLNSQNIQVDGNTYFVGHSLGCITIARFLEKLPSKNIAGGCVFVAGFSSFLEVPILRDFCILPLDFSLVRKHSKEFVVVISDDDKVIPNALSEEFAEKLGAKVIVEHKKGHFVTGTKEIRSVLEIILEMNHIKGKRGFWRFFGF